MAYYPPILIVPFSSMQAMMNALSNPRHNGKVWQAKLWGQVGDLKKVSEKESMLYDWIFLVKILWTLENYAKENNYDTFCSTTQYRISLVTDMTGSVLDNTSFIIEHLASNSIKIHSNYMAYSEDYRQKIKLQDVRYIASVLKMMREDVKEIVDQILGVFFMVNESGSLFCPPQKIQKIYANCLSLATSM